MRNARPACGKIAPARAAPEACPSSTSEIARATARVSPASTRPASTSGGAATGVTIARHQMARDDQALNLARAFADRRQLDVAEELLGWIVLDEPVAAVDLDTIFGGAHGNLAGVELGHGRFDRRTGPSVLEG